MIESDGLFDLQVNGFAGVDFNDASITPHRLDIALAAMRSTGVTGCLPTLITASEDDLKARIVALDRAVARSRLGPVMVPGYHIEGPFLNAGEGYRGCHPQEAMCDPEALLYARLADGLTRPILLVTLAPERRGSIEAIRSLRAAGICVAVGHSAATAGEIHLAAEAGLTLATHLGNGVPRQLPRTDNPVLAQLSEPRLAACFIADGHHIAPGALGALLRIKGIENSILVTDAVLAAGATEGSYRFAGMDIVRDTDGVVRRPGQDNLAGSALTLDAAVRNVVRWGLASPDQALRMASANPRAAIAEAVDFHGVDRPAGRVRWSADLNPIGLSA
jgi:N-acetylglucosamine-6-phosphate deacetylase